VAKLDELEVRRLVDAIHDLHEAPSASDFPKLSLEVTGALVRNDLIAFNEVDPATGRATALVYPLIELTDRQHRTLAELSHEHPAITHLNETGDGSAHRISDFISVEEFQQRRIYRELYADLAMEHQISFTLPSVRPRIIALALNRTERGDDFDERDRLVLNLLRPHLAQAFEHSKERDRVRAVLSTMSGAMAADGTHMVLLGDVPTDGTPGSLMLLYRYFGAPGARDPFPTRVSHWLDAQRRRLITGGQGAPPGILRPLTRERAGQQLVLRYLPGGPSCVETLLINERSGPASPPELEQLGLTHREAEVLSFLGSGATNAEIATALHISAGTVKKHLDNVYRKLGVRGRIQAVAMATALLPADRREQLPGPVEQGP
jgi:DNA-binding CsgD family transcriptional regulator